MFRFRPVKRILLLSSSGNSSSNSTSSSSSRISSSSVGAVSRLVESFDDHEVIFRRRTTKDLIRCGR